MAVLPVLSVQLIYVVATAMALGLSGVLWRNREKTGAVSLGGANFAATIWAGSLLGITLTEGLLAQIFLRTLYLGVVLGVFTVFVFALEYTGRERYITPKVLALLSVHPVVTMALVIFNPGGLFFPDISVAAVAIGGNPEEIWGPAFYAHTAYSYLVLLTVAVMVLELLLRSERPLYRGQAVALLGATFVPWLLNATFLFGPVEFDVTPVGFIVTTSLFTVAIVRYGLINIAPIAREKVVENVRDGMFVVDTDNTIIDSNPAFRSLIGLDEESLVGMDATELFGNLPGILDLYEEMTVEETTTEQQVTYGDRYLSVQTTPIRDDRDRHVGWLFLVHDVTELVQRERDLEQQIEKLDQFASIVSHDLRNPLNVARGYVQHVQATGDTDYLDKTDEAMERMEAIIEDALALAREGEDVTEPTEVSVREVADDAWANVDTEAASLETDDETIMADEKRLQRLFENIFRNSVEHGSTSNRPETDDSIEHGVDGTEGAEFAAGHVVEVGIETESPDTVTVYVADNGVGIPEDDIEDVFESGYTTNEDGTGLGLSIVQQIASAHGWEVEAKDSDAGGARFEITGVARPV
jgi:PAS domain S-box-containing protein